MFRYVRGYGIMESRKKKRISDDCVCKDTEESSNFFKSDKNFKVDEEAFKEKMKNYDEWCTNRKPY